MDSDYIGFVYIGIIAAVIILIQLMKAMYQKRHNGDYKKSLSQAANYAVMVLMLFIGAGSMLWMQKRSFDKIPSMEVKDNQVTMVNIGYKGLSSTSKVFMNNHDVVEQVGTPDYRYQHLKKFGYTFAAKKPGNVKILVEEFEGGYESYADIYSVDVAEDGTLTCEHLDHIPNFRMSTRQRGLRIAFGFSEDDLRG